LFEKTRENPFFVRKKKKNQPVIGWDEHKMRRFKKNLLFSKGVSTIFFVVPGWEPDKFAFSGSSGGGFLPQTGRPHRARGVE
jgi:hypothetical protein